ncbi:MAG: pirin family protein [Rhodospirillaceae bacterium]|nr:pirin family protein [Rhodospirillaceae bacterium]
MISIRKGTERGHFRNDWLDSRHSFSFGGYYDPQHLGFSALRVINDDLIGPGGGFPTHGHKDMEIITYVLDGAIEHKDSLGNGSVIRPGDIQRMSAGSGIMHSEFNPQAGEGTRLLQIWLLPNARGIAPGYEQIHVPASERSGKLKLVASPDGREGGVTIHQDALLYAGTLKPGEVATLSLADKRTAWVQVAKGAVTLNGTAMAEGDGAAVKKETALNIAATQPAEVLVFDLPPVGG